MINHIRTLLLNETQGSLGRSGLPYGVPWFVSPSFLGVEVPDRLVPFRDALFRGAVGLDGRIDRVNAVMTVLSAPDMSEFVGLFDGRSTVENESARTVSDLYRNMRSASGGFDSAVLGGSWTSCGLYSPTGDAKFDRALPRLMSIGCSPFEFVPSVAAPILAYCIQLEGLRVKRNA